MRVDTVVLHHCHYQCLKSHLADGVRSSGGGHAGCVSRSGASMTRCFAMRTRRSTFLPWWCFEDATLYHVRCRAVCLHAAVKAQAYPPAEGCPQSGCPSRGARSTAARSASGPYQWLGRSVSPLAAVNGRAARSTGGTRRWCIRQSGKDIRWCYILIGMPSDNRYACLTLHLSDSVVVRLLIYDIPLQLDSRNATICGQGGKSHV